MVKKLMIAAAAAAAFTMVGFASPSTAEAGHCYHGGGYGYGGGYGGGFYRAPVRAYYAPPRAYRAYRPVVAPRRGFYRGYGGYGYGGFGPGLGIRIGF